MKVRLGKSMWLSIFFVFSRFAIKLPHWRKCQEPFFLQNKPLITKCQYTKKAVVECNGKKIQSPSFSDNKYDMIIMFSFISCSECDWKLQRWEAPSTYVLSLILWELAVCNNIQIMHNSRLIYLSHKFAHGGIQGHRHR